MEDHMDAKLPSFDTEMISNAFNALDSFKSEEDLLNLSKMNEQFMEIVHSNLPQGQELREFKDFFEAYHQGIVPIILTELPENSEAKVKFIETSLKLNEVFVNFAKSQGIDSGKIVNLAEKLNGQRGITSTTTPFNVMPSLEDEVKKATKISQNLRNDKLALITQLRAGDDKYQNRIGRFEKDLQKLDTVFTTLKQAEKELNKTSANLQKVDEEFNQKDKKKENVEKKEKKRGDEDRNISEKKVSQIGRAHV